MGVEPSGDAKDGILDPDLGNYIGGFAAIG